MNRPLPEEYNAYYSKYINTVDDNVMAELEHQANSFSQFLQSIPEEKSLYAYAADKWTIREVVGHVTDTERIMAYRALRLARNDQTPLPGFNENLYVENSFFNNRTLQSLREEFTAVRRANLFLFKSFTDDELKRTGICSDAVTTVKALIFITAGHVNHHRRILQERYL